MPPAAARSGRAGRRRRGRRRRASPRGCPRSRAPFAADRARSAPRAAAAASIAVRRSLSFSKPAVTSFRNWCIGECWRVGSRSSASLDASPSKYVPSRVRIRPIALSRFVSSNSSSTNARSAPRSPRNLSSVRGRRPSPSAKFARRTWSSASAAVVLACSVWRELLELVADEVDVDRRGRVLEREQADLQGALDERRPVRRLALGEDGGERRVADDQAVDDDPVASTRISGVGSWRIRASMTGILAGRDT